MQREFEKNVLKGWQDVADETTRILGEEETTAAYRYLDCLAILNALKDTYGDDFMTGHVVPLCLPMLLKDIVWSNMLFLWGNYPAVLRNLRFNWEMAFRAIYVDTYRIVVTDDTLWPGPTVDDKIVWLGLQESKLNRKSLIDPLLSGILGTDTQGVLDSGLPALWDKLNKRVHPSRELLDEVFDHPTRPMLDVFHESAARETLQAVHQVFDVIWLGILTVFHHVIPKLDDPEQFRACPRTQAFIAKKRLEGP